MRSQVTDWEKILAEDTSKIYKKLKHNNLINKWANDLTDISLKRIYKWQISI